MDSVDFTPAPKRFMVWSKEEKRFLAVRDAYPKCQLSEEESNRLSLSMQELHALLGEVMYFDDEDDYIVLQSTTLFDKDGKEIFEGSIVLWNRDMGVVKSRNGKWVFHVITPAFDVYHQLGPNADIVKIIGHVLSNPELLKKGE